VFKAEMRARKAEEKAKLYHKELTKAKEDIVKERKKTA